MQVFHKRHRHLLLFAMFGGVYLPSLSRIIPWKPVNTFLKGYAATFTTGMLLLGTLALKHALFQADNLMSRLASVNNFFDDFLAFGRILLFNLHRKQAQDLYDLWDEYFTGDGHDHTRKKLIENLKRPYKKIFIISGISITFMACFWSIDQFDNKDCEFSLPMGVPFQNKNPEYLIWATIIFLLLSVYGPMVLAADLLTMEPLIWITAEFIRLKESLAEILNVLQVAENGEILKKVNGSSHVVLNKKELQRDFKHVDEQINQWIIDHQKLLIFHRKTVAFINGPLIVQLLCTTSAICLFCYLFALKIYTTVDSVIVVLVYLPNYLLFYLIAKCGDMVRKEGEGVFDNAFATCWMVYPNHIQIKLHIIALRTNYPVTTNIMKIFPLSSRTYFQIVETAYSFYNFLLFITVKNNMV